MTMLTVKPSARRVNLPRFSGMLENFFENDFPVFFNNEWERSAVPSVNIKDTREAYKLEVAAPGFKKDNFTVKVEDKLLTISGEASENKESEGERFTRKEFSSTSFKRSFTLPETVAAENITAAYEDGILLISLPKRVETKEKGSIEVKIS